LAQTDRTIDLMLTDIVMPGERGKQLAGQALRLRPGLKIVYMTGYSRNAVVHQGRLDAGVDLIQKPVSQADLAARIRRALDKGQQHH
jgi:FixJ family two-component response regulator